MAGFRPALRAASIEKAPAIVQLQLSDPQYSERLASFLQTLGQAATASASGRVELADVEEAELEVYLRVWRVLNPEVEVEILR